MSKSLFTDASSRLERALKYVSISDDAIERLKYPKASLSVSIPVRMDTRPYGQRHFKNLPRLPRPLR